MPRAGPQNTEHAFAQAWNAVDSLSAQPNTESQNAHRHSIHAYAIASTVGTPQRPVHAHLAPKPSIITIGQSHAQDQGLPRDESTFSIASSGISLEEVQAPQPVLNAAVSRTPGNYKCVVTNFTPLTGSTETIDEEKDVEAVTYSLQPLESFSYRIAAKGELDALMTASPLPEIAWATWFAKWRFATLSVYRRLWALVIVANVVAMAVMFARLAKRTYSFTYEDAATATGANLAVAALVRHEHFINLLFRLVCFLPDGTPLAIRKSAAMVYSYGGVHSGCGISALLWYVIYTVLMVVQYRGSDGIRMALAATAAVTLMLLIVIIAMAHPFIRRRWHNKWELSHRYGGWAAIVFVWAQTLILVISKANQASHAIGKTLATTPTFYFLLLITAILIYPWLRLRKRKFEAEKLSSHAVRLHFNDRSLPSCVGYRLAHNPLTENHGFATIPNPNGENGYSIVVSNAGDWTKSLINNPPQKVWTRGAPTIGVMRVASLFRPIIVVATGSGIGPCLSFLQVHPDHSMRIIWSTRFPETTYGPEIMKAVLRADRRAMIIDTKKTGTPDLPALTYAMAKAENAEAVVVISNPTVTKKVVFEMEARGVAAFGPIFDS
ncbi:hypothetical protein LTR37_013754 [Vermiconidia calcicola]|uniref:Uncharacterized protein n=1 Tax=Vermiconidia calcicola TaxID=1690605 RepID=A0ACC3MVL1_9PEZI|nr:hypothetical protein LTR37_013754 [Vermiconidia calcicola]